MRHKLHVIWHVIAGHPVIYRAKFESATIQAIKNPGLQLYTCTNVHINLAGYPGKVFMDGRIVHEGGQ